MANKYYEPWFNKNNQNRGTVFATSVPNSSDEKPPHGFYGFHLYFFDTGTLNLDQIIENTNTFYDFIERNKFLFDLPKIINDHFFTCDYKTLIEDEILDKWKDLKVDLMNNSEYYLNCMGLAMHQFIIDDSRKTNPENVIRNIDVIRARLINYEPITKLGDLKVNCYGKLVSVRGTVIRASSLKMICKLMAFSCSNCNYIQIVQQNDGNYTMPTKCLGQNCRSQSNFNPLLTSKFTQTTNWQTIKVQELIGSENYENGRVPRILDCELTDDLVKACIPGDDITITGVIKVQNNNESSNKTNQPSIFTMYLNAISIVNNKSQFQSAYGASERITLNSRDYDAIKEIHLEPNLFRFLVQSLCPNIYGHEIVKAGLLLALFGGTKNDKNRAESHILMVGDPGLGKSQMLQACSNVAPRGIYVCGNTSTSSGLTVTMTRESGGEYGLEAGALMLADQGCCCIDEFDKIPSQHACLLEAMEQQSISIAKAGIVCTLPTRTTILAAANPAGGHYNKGKTIVENLKISSPMLSRFDLIFILLDQPNRELDKRLSKYILEVHSGVKHNNNTTTVYGDENNSVINQNDSLRERLLLAPNEKLDVLPHSLFRKYIAYAQKNFNPRLTEKAKEILKTYYLELRKQFQCGQSTPVTTRQLNSLIRLTQARAKIELREEATEQDALDVVEIMKQSLVDIFTDEFGVMDATRSQNGTGMSTRNQAMKLLQLLQKKSEQEAKSVFNKKEIKELSQQAGINGTKFVGILDSLNVQGFLLNKGQNNYQLVSGYV